MCLKIHSCHLHASFRGRSAPNSLNVAHYAAFIRNRAPTKCDVHLTESNFQTRSKNGYWFRHCSSICSYDS
ncbi:DUF6783 domain-containing protein [Hungatella hominis]|uniref:DUF6783 domain-containing protein n=1 Tax=Hungatella TaxID=1649459 RepID=UPI0032E4EF06